MFTSSPERWHTGCPQNPACPSFLSKEVLGGTAHFFSVFPFCSHHFFLLLLLLLNRQQMHTGQCPVEGKSPSSSLSSIPAIQFLCLQATAGPRLNCFCLSIGLEIFLLMQPRVPACAESTSMWAGVYSKHMRHVGLFARFSSYLAVSFGVKCSEVNLRSETSWVNVLMTQHHI